MNELLTLKINIVFWKFTKLLIKTKRGMLISPLKQLSKKRISDVYVKWVEQAAINFRSSHGKMLRKRSFLFCK